GVSVSITISLAGSCAIYAHARLDAASNTYSDLGNISVYAGGQTWVGGGGSCTAGSNAGSTNAVCADGYELSGHNAITCGAGGTNAFLSAGDAAINPNPCAAGKAAQPVPPISTNLPPAPNTESARLRHFITATMPAGSQAGTLLVATVSAETTPNKFGAPAGWVSAAEANQVGEGRSEIWYYPNNPGGISSVTFTMNPATING